MMVLMNTPPTPIAAAAELAPQAPESVSPVGAASLVGAGVAAPASAAAVAWSEHSALLRYSMPGMLYSPVELGTIRIGHLDDDGDGRVVPVRDDQFRITHLVRRRRGEWLLHPMHGRVFAARAQAVGASGEKKLREIPVFMPYDSPDLIVRSRLEAFDLRSRRPVCASVGNARARRLGPNGEALDVACPGAADCTFAQEGGVRCKFFGRINVQVSGQADPDNVFVLRSSSFNTLRNFEARLARYWALFGGRLTGVPFKLVLRTRTTSGSMWSQFHFVDLQLDGVGLAEAAQRARTHAQQMQADGLDVAAHEAVVRAGLANGALSCDETEGALMHEFYAADGDETGTAADLTDGLVESAGAGAAQAASGGVSAAAGAVATAPVRVAVPARGVRVSGLRLAPKAVTPDAPGHTTAV